MRSFQAFVAAVERWYHPLPGENHRRWWNLTWIPRGHPQPGSSIPESLLDLNRSGIIHPKPLKPILKTTPRPSSDRRDYSKLALTLTVVTLTGVLGQRFYNQPGLQVGSIAPKPFMHRTQPPLKIAKQPLIDGEMPATVPYRC
ncbi:MAG: hypothetical protein LVS60_05715 [Nodosilinea sp. LVE1205-7]|jgi:hypothetical protein